MFTALYQIAKNTMRESLREPIFLLVLLTAMCMMGLFPIFTMFYFHAQEKLVVDSAMATTMIFGWVTAVLIASYAISREIDNGTALLLLSKPVRRPVFIVAKILGVLGAVSCFWALAAMATLINLRVAQDQFRMDFVVMGIYFGAIILSFVLAGIHNYVVRSSFPMTTVICMLILMPIVTILAHFLHYQGAHVGLNTTCIPALILILYSVWAMATLATALSTRLNLVSNLLVCLVLFMLGLMSDYLFGRQAREPWYDSVPKGEGTLWMCQYRFAPTEMTKVGKWERPVDLDHEWGFVVWSDQTKPVELQVLGESPEAMWRDGQGWKKNPNDLDSPAEYMATYDKETQKWSVVHIRHERDDVEPGATGLDAAFTSVVFRRGNNPPRVPDGGNYVNPYPTGGSFVMSAFYALIPNWQLFWMADALSANVAIPVTYVVYGGIYVVLMIIMLMVFAVAMFWEREVGTQIIN